MEQNAQMVDLRAILNYASISFSATDPHLKHCNPVKMGFCRW